MHADWAVLTDPHHLRELIKKTNLKPYLGKQIVHPDAVENRPYPEPTEKTKGEKKDV